jgi:hypothetical protein
VNPREVAPHSYVRSELVDFTIDREPRIVADRDEWGPIYSGRYNGIIREISESGILVKGGLEDRRTRLRHHRVTAGVRGMLRASFGIRLWSK